MCVSFLMFSENIKKEICRIFSHNGLRITIEANKQTINFLNISFILNKAPTSSSQSLTHGTVRPPREQPFTNHRKEHTAGINKRLSSLSSDKASFDQAVPPLPIPAKTGNGTTYSGTTLHSAKTSAPISDTDKHFPKAHRLRKNFNRNTIKVSFSCMNNTKQIIDNYNKRILSPSEHIDSTADSTAINTKDNKTCNCRQNNTCPLNGNYLQSSVLYQATVTRKDNSTSETYIGLTENDFKTRYRNHTASFRRAKHRNSTELSKNIWTLKDNNISHFIS